MLKTIPGVDVGFEDNYLSTQAAVVVLSFLGLELDKLTKVAIPK
jgi:deoxyinosine 3'endonuclease (endonuclease V)